MRSLPANDCMCLRMHAEATRRGRRTVKSVRRPRTLTLEALAQRLQIPADAFGDVR
jgi:hypothetical protein